MGNPGAYLSISREEHRTRPPEEVLCDFEEFAVPLNEDAQRLQASRCMMCGVAFCQAGFSFGKARPSGCPLHNLIPEFNDLVYRGLWDEAALRLRMTNPFPEFTGRVCPALCEAACNLAYVDAATTIRDNERAISDHEWASGGPALIETYTGTPAGKKGKAVKKIAVVGSGPAGLACAWALRSAGKEVQVFEKSDRAGGLLMYGIPNMKLPKEVVERRIRWLEACGITFTCNFNASEEQNARMLQGSFDAIVVAAGAGNPRTLNVDGKDSKGVHFAVDYLTANTRAILEKNESSLSAKDLEVVVIGGGDTGCDCVATALRQGAKNVTQLEFMPAAPDKPRADNAWPEWPNVKKTDYGQIEAIYKQGQDPRLWGIDTLQLVADENGQVARLDAVRLDWSKGSPEKIENSNFSLDAQMVLIACGFIGPKKEIYEALGVSVSQDARALPISTSLKTPHRLISASGISIFAAGDARTGSSLVVNAIADGIACAKEILAL